MKKTLLFVAFAAVVCFVRCSTEVQKPDRDIISLYYDDEMLIQAREAVHSKDKAIWPAFIALRDHTDTAYLNMDPLSITFDRIRTAPSRDPRDYIPLSPYWWPYPQDPDAPYINKDGERNPEVYEYHERVRSGLFGRAVQDLAVTYFLTGDEKYATKATELIRTWFTDGTTGMNPHLTYAQHVPGMTYIRGTGIIDAQRFITGINAAMIIADSEAWTAEDERAMQGWANNFRYWLEHSVQGLAETKSTNNHGLWFEVFRQICVLYSGNHDYMRQVVTESQLPRIGEQVAEDGGLPQEIRRTLGLHYTTFALEAWTFSAIMANKVGIDIWGTQAENGRNLSMAIDYVLPYWQNPTSWPHQQIAPFEASRAAVVLANAGKALGNSAYTNAAAQIGVEFNPNDDDNSQSSYIRDVLYYNIAK